MAYPIQVILQINGYFLSWVGKVEHEFDYFRLLCLKQEIGY